MVGLPALPRNQRQMQYRHWHLASTVTSSSEPAAREYLLPIRSRVRLVDDDAAGDEDKSSNNYIYTTPGIVTQTGTVDCTIVGRTKRPLKFTQDIQEPTIHLQVEIS